MNHVFFFNHQTAGPQANTFTIIEDGSLPANAAAVGSGMAGSATFAVQSMPKMSVQIVGGRGLPRVVRAQLRELLRGEPDHVAR